MSTARKAIVALVFAAAGALGATALDGDITQSEAVAALGAGLVAGAGTYAIPNAAPARRRRRT